MKLAVGVLCGAQFMLIVDVVVLNVALPSIQQGLAIAEGQLALAGVLYTLTFGLLLIAGGRAGDVYGRLRVFQIGLGVFTLASALAAIAQTPWQLFAARALQGVGAAMVSPNTLALVTAMFEEGEKRNRVLGFWGATGSVGAISGQLIGGVLTEFLGWRSIFLINIPIGVAGMLIAARVLTESRGGSPIRAAVRALVGNKAVRTGNIVLALIAGTTAATLFFSTLYLQGTLDYSPMAVGFGFAPVTVVVLLVSPVAGRLVGKLGARNLMLCGALLSAAGMAYLALIDSNGNYFADVLPGLLAVAAGNGLAFAPTMITATTGVAADDQGLASGVLNTSQELGTAAGMAVITGIATAVGAGIAGYQVGYLVAAGLVALAAVVALRTPGTVGRPALTEPAERARIDM
ncbi:MFS transporter [Kibdelosporangium aridum]|uniref:Predicted arabinose efflux permease, MFS family n=1 Tax=Kibdelosporangium aridum TaxID=2030 RepID=A0A1W2FEN5_KIBAR|nr:MFS transporter [Kibdelosporangium aridum]SMD20313.1 Predicted arabinose efflux permease, MFS family [Kibdelosporangium aridum]